MVRKQKPRNNIQFAALLSSGIDSFGTGSFVSVSTVFFSTYSHVSPSIIGIGLTLSAITGMISSLPVGYLADKYGRLKLFSISYFLRGVGALCWLFISGNLQFLIYMSLFGIIDRSAASLTRSLIISPLSKRDATVLMGKMMLPTNIGYGLGAGFSFLLLAINWGLMPTVITNSLSFLLVIFLYRTALKGVAVTSGKVLKKPISIKVIKSALANKFRRLLIMENFLFSFHRTLLSVYVPLIVVMYFKNYSWLSPMAFIINTVVISLFQGKVNTWAAENRRYDRLWVISGAIIAASFLVTSVTTVMHIDTLIFMALLMLIVSQVLAELFSSAALAMYMVIYSRSESLTTDLSAINLGGQLQNILGPTMFGSAAVSSNGLISFLMFTLTAAVSAHAYMYRGLNKEELKDEL
ncbi:MFS transporter [Lacticaseibacillus casei]|uniref:Major facilitator superfamily MFS 1 transporter n=3 Tax=Lacticaseibacillus TaxID=2759736 RepID=A0A0R1EV90_LACZE|nr:MULTISPECIES: MFS transporter [Lacticaseibacillus]OFR98629.1 MFS transporter [Lactobacillus sp. HMSC068F07]KRK13336.1 major facilitator superfamily MFS 1 transporter [Lacticaseibacillus zeae DSM 20178 = KCTC 3804]MDE3316278.1 MFS transporter [Lacticaseibacillus zeae]MDG3062132.1 MFS transporter [Lacticaseibacillus sp. BCRC 81376]OLS05997.1 MFS transporter [Lacticaseibacillus casei]